MPRVISVEDQQNCVPTTQFPYAFWKFQLFNPVQSRVLEVVEGDSNIGIAAATAAGKTACAEMFMSYELLKRGGKALYIGPMKALAKQKERNWKKHDHHFVNRRISICTGDFRITNRRIEELDSAEIIIMTPEMLASRCRNQRSEKSNFLKETGVIVLDESHLLTVPGRGDHIEVALAKLTELNPNARIVMLSATMPNVHEICEWVSKLNGRDTYFINSKYRPCPLGVHYETYYDGGGSYLKKEAEKIGISLGLVEYYGEDKFLVFVHTKRTGQMMIDALRRHQIDAEFHNADVDLEDRSRLEKQFEEDPKFRVIVATSTLAWGLDLPARRVVVVGVDRGMQRVANYDIQQMIGRAGRPGFDPRGDAYILVPESKKIETINTLKKPTPISSQLLESSGGHYKTLAFHIVSEIHHGCVRTKEGFHEWFRRSLAHHQDEDEFDDRLVDKVIDSLVRCRAIVIENDEYKATSIGVVASMFYYSPFDVTDLRDNFTTVFSQNKRHEDLHVAVALANIDSHRLGIVNTQERQEMSRFAGQVANAYGAKVIKDGAIKAAFGYHNILNGLDNPTFGALQANLKFDSERTMEVLSAIDSMSAKWDESDYLKTLRLRLRYGVRPELVSLCGIPNIKKARAEHLWKAGIHTVDDFIGQDEGTLAKLMKVKVEMARECLEEAKRIVVKNML